MGKIYTANMNQKKSGIITFKKVKKKDFKIKKQSWASIIIKIIKILKQEIIKF